MANSAVKEICKNWVYIFEIFSYVDLKACIPLRVAQ